MPCALAGNDSPTQTRIASATGMIAQRRGSARRTMSIKSDLDRPVRERLTFVRLADCAAPVRRPGTMAPCFCQENPQLVGPLSSRPACCEGDVRRREGTLRVGRNCGLRSVASARMLSFAPSPPERPNRCPERSRRAPRTRGNPFEGATRTMLLFSRFIALLSGLAVLVLGGAALAALGHPTAWQTGLQDAGSPVMENIIWFHHLLLIIIAIITGVVLALLISVMVRFNQRAHPTPSRTTHRTSLEVAWTVIPIAILVFIAVPSFRLLFLEQNIPSADVTVKATGKQCYWTYGYPDEGKFEFDSLMIQDKDLKPDQPRLLSVDNEMVVPVEKIVRVQVTGSDVIHSFAVPSFGVKIDAVPGRLNETWFKATKEGIY